MREIFGLQNKDELFKGLMADFSMISSFAALKLIAITREELNPDEKATKTIQDVISVWEDRIRLHFEKELKESEQAHDSTLNALLGNMTLSRDEIKKHQEEELEKALTAIKTTAFAGMDVWEESQETIKETKEDKPHLSIVKMEVDNDE